MGSMIPRSKDLSEDGNFFSAQHLGANGSDARHASRSLLCVLRARNKQINSRRPYRNAPTFQLKIPAVGAHSPCAAPPNPGPPLRSLPPHIVERERVGWPQLAALAIETPSGQAPLRWHPPSRDAGLERYERSTAFPGFPRLLAARVWLRTDTHRARALISNQRNRHLVRRVRHWRGACSRVMSPGEQRERSA